MIGLLLLSLFISGAGAQDTCEQLVLDNKSDFTEQMNARSIPVEKFVSLTQGEFTRTYENQRKLMVVGKSQPVNIYVALKSETINGSEGGEAVKIKHAVDTVKYFIDKSKKSTPGVEVNFVKEQLNCRIKTRYANQSPLETECVARVCIKAVAYEKKNDLPASGASQ